MNLNVKSYLKFIFVTFISFYILDKLYYNSVYSDLDYIQTLINVNHSLRYYLFILFCGSCLFIVNLITYKLIESKGSKIIVVINIFTLLFIFYLLRTDNVSKLFTVSISIILFVLYNSSFLNEHKYLKLEYRIYFILISIALSLNYMN